MTMDERDHDDTAGEGPVEVPAAAARLLTGDAVWADPPPWLGESVVATIAAERDSAGTTVASVPASSRPRRGVHDRWWLAAAALIAVLALGVAVLLPDRDGSDELALRIEGTELAPRARAAATVEDLAAGVAIRLDVSGLAPAPPGTYYQGWVRSEAGELVSIGTFHLRGGDGRVTLWSGVPIDDYPTLTVTRQREGEGTESSGEVVLRGSLRP